MIEATFGQGTPWSVGVEEEIMILDADSLALAPAVGVLVREADAIELPGRLKTELFASIVELNTRICASPQEALAALAALRRTTSAIARRNGLKLACAGSHPFSVPEEQPIEQEERYLEFVRYAGVSARRQGVSGLHVHVAVPSAEACFHALEGVLPWLPLVLALSANSPYLAGRATGLASNRAEILAQLPRAGAPPAFSSYAEWEAYVERLVALGLASDYTRLWWDVRPHPRFGTLELRTPDQPTSLALTGVFIALLQALVVAVLRRPGRPYDPPGRGLYAQNRWAALRFGPRAELIHPDGDRLAKVPELTEELLGLVRPAARELGTADLLAPLDPSRCEGDRQLQVGQAHGLRAVCADLVERSAVSAACGTRTPPPS